MAEGGILGPKTARLKERKGDGETVVWTKEKEVGHVVLRKLSSEANISYYVSIRSSFCSMKLALVLFLTKRPILFKLNCGLHGKPFYFQLQ